MVGRSGEKTSVCNTRPREGTMGDIEAAGHGAHAATAMYVHVRHIHTCFDSRIRFIFIFFINHCPLPKEIIPCRPLEAVHFLYC